MLFRYDHWLALLVLAAGCGNAPSPTARASGSHQHGAGTGGLSPIEEAGNGGERSLGGSANQGGNAATSADTDGGTGGRPHASGTGASGTASHAGTSGRAGTSSDPSDGDGGTHGVAGSANEPAGAPSAGEGGANEAGGEHAGGASGDNGAAAGAAGGEPSLVLVPGVSERKRRRSNAGFDIVLESELVSFTTSDVPKSRLRRLTRALQTEALWQAPDNAYISDFCLHPSGAISVVLVAADQSVSLVRLDSELAPLGSLALHDPAVATDPHSAELGVTDLSTTGFTWDAARIGANGEDVFTTVVTTLNSVIGYRLSFANGAWSAPARTLVEPPAGLTPFLPIGGSFDTFGAIVAWFRAELDLDPDGNAYVVVWANPSRIRAHAGFFADGLTPLPGDSNVPAGSDSDLLLTKLDAAGARAWSRVVGSEHEDEPYALRATRTAVAVVGRSRRFPGFDNTAWDALVSVTSASGTESDSVTLELDASSILLGVDARPSGGWIVAGSDGWSQNPDGLSILNFGSQLLLELPALDAAPIRRAVAAGPRQNELHAVLALPDGIAFSGLEDGPITHTGDGDLTAIHATGVLGFVSP